MSRSWHVLRTEPRAEYLAADLLSEDGFEVYFPRVQSPDKRAGHDDTPLFPGYLFLKFDPQTEDWPSFHSNHRVAGWVNFQGMVPSVPESVMTKLKETVESLNSGNGLWQRYRQGEKVRVVSNNIDSLAEIVEEARSPQGQAKVLMNFMGRIVPARVPWTDLRTISAQTDEKPRLPRRTRGRGRFIRGIGLRATDTT